jgi:hypothetical protein
MLGVASVLAVATLAVAGATAGGRPDPTAVAALEKFLSRPPVVHQYVASRRLEAAGKGRRGWLEAQTSFTVASGLQYEVTSEGGSGYIRRRILRSLLEEERDLITRDGRRAAALSPANYRFTPERINEEGLAVVGLQPLRKEKSLIAGHILLAPADGDLVRLEGRLSRNPSFWVTRVAIVRSYRRIDGALMPVSLDTTAQLRLLGASALRMTYEYLEIDQRPVKASETEPGV